MINETQLTIAKQIEAKQLKFCGFKLIVHNEVTIAVYKNSKTVIISYNEGQDLYNVRLCRINKKTLAIEEKNLDRIYFDQLKELIENHFNFKYVNMNFKVIEVA